MVKIQGTLVRIQPGGFGVVRLDSGKEAYFDRFAQLASKAGDGHRPGCRVVAEAESTDTDIVRLMAVSLADD